MWNIIEHGVPLSLFLIIYDKGTYPSSHLQGSRKCITADLGLVLLYPQIWSRRGWFHSSALIYGVFCISRPLTWHKCLSGCSWLTDCTYTDSSEIPPKVIKTWIYPCIFLLKYNDADSTFDLASEFSAFSFLRLFFLRRMSMISKNCFPFVKYLFSYILLSTWFRIFPLKSFHWLLFPFPFKILDNKQILSEKISFNCSDSCNLGYSLRVSR